MPAGAFFRGLLFFYGLELTHLKPNSIAQIVIIVHLCEGFLGIAAHFNLCRALYHLKGHPSNNRRKVVGGATFSLRQGRSYPDLNLHDSNKGRTRSGSWCRTRPPTFQSGLAACQSTARAGRSCWEAACQSTVGYKAKEG